MAANSAGAICLTNFGLGLRPAVDLSADMLMMNNSKTHIGSSQSLIVAFYVSAKLGVLWRWARVWAVGCGVRGVGCGARAAELSCCSGSAPGARCGTCCRATPSPR